MEVGVGEASGKAKGMLQKSYPNLSPSGPNLSYFQLAQHPPSPKLLYAKMPNASSYDFLRHPSTLCPAPSLGLLRAGRFSLFREEMGWK